MGYRSFANEPGFRSSKFTVLRLPDLVGVHRTVMKEGNLNLLSAVEISSFNNRI